MRKIIGLLLLGACSICAEEISLEGIDSEVVESVKGVQLPITAEEEEMIYRIIDTLGTTSTLFLLPKYSELRDLGNRVQHVHPLKFLEIVFTDPHLKACMYKVEDSSLKWKGFLKGNGKTPGFLAKCEREFARDNFAPHILSFCQAVHADPDEVRELIENKEWEELLRMLVYLENE